MPHGAPALRLSFENFARQLLNALSGIPGPRNTPADSTRSDALSHSLSRSRGHMARRRAPVT